MDFHSLGHATWLAEVDGLRLLFDPLLDDLHHGGIFEVFPPRTIDCEALAPDFIFVSHRHPDHFDLPSLRKLAALDPESVIVTPDDLVASCATRLGFKSVRVIAPETTIDLDGPRLVTTPSRGARDPEWGIVVANDEGAVYNQIDTSIGTPSDVRAFFERVAHAQRARSITLALARWHPLLEVDAMLAGSIGFPFESYFAELDRAAALDAKVIVPASAGVRHVGPHAWMNQLVYPVPEERFIADARRRMPRTRVERCTTGATFRVRDGDVSIDPHGAARLVTLRSRSGALGSGSSGSALDDPRMFRPFEIPPVIDPNLDARPIDDVRLVIDRWVREVLAPALTRPLRHVLEVVLPDRTDTYTLVGGEAPKRSDDLDWDVRCVVAGTLLLDVIEARRHWGDVLLGGMLRACSRACSIDERGGRAAVVQPLFVYEAIDYDTSVARALEAALRAHNS